MNDSKNNNVQILFVQSIRRMESCYCIGQYMVNEYFLPGCHSDICLAILEVSWRFIIENKYLLNG
jgi:hypothetical protein